MEKKIRIAFILREIHNQIKLVSRKSAPRLEKAPPTQLQAGILGYLYHHGDSPVYQRDLEKEFKISRATATNTLQVMEHNGSIVRRTLDQDARLKRIRLTEEAYQCYRQVEVHMETMDKRLLQGMSGEEVGELYRLLGILRKNLEEYAAELDEPPGEEGRKSAETPEPAGCPKPDAS